MLCFRTGCLAQLFSDPSKHRIGPRLGFDNFLPGKQNVTPLTMVTAPILLQQGAPNTGQTHAQMMHKTQAWVLDL